MLKGLKHAIICTKCQDTIAYCDSYDEAEKKIKKDKSECCNAEFEYIGLQPFHETPLKVPVIKVAQEIDDKIEIINEQPKVEVPEEKVVEVIKEEVQIEETPIVEEVIVEDKTNIEVKVIEAKAEAETITDVKEAKINIDDLVPKNAKGKVTNTQMIPVMKDALQEGSVEKLKLMKQAYPDIFEGSFKYLGAKLQKQIKDLAI